MFRIWGQGFRIQGRDLGFQDLGFQDLGFQDLGYRLYASGFRICINGVGFRVQAGLKV